MDHVTLTRLISH